MDISCLIHSLVNGHLEWVLHSAIMDDAAIKICVRVFSIKVLHMLSFLLGVDFGPYGNYVITFQETAKLFSSSIYFLISNSEGSNFSVFSTSLCTTFIL